MNTRASRYSTRLIARNSADTVEGVPISTILQGTLRPFQHKWTRELLWLTHQFIRRYFTPAHCTRRAKIFSIPNQPFNHFLASVGFIRPGSNDLNAILKAKMKAKMLYEAGQMAPLMSEPGRWKVGTEAILSDEWNGNLRRLWIPVCDSQVVRDQTDTMVRSAQYPASEDEDDYVMPANRHGDVRPRSHAYQVEHHYSQALAHPLQISQADIQPVFMQERPPLTNTPGDSSHGEAGITQLLQQAADTATENHSTATIQRTQAPVPFESPCQLNQNAIAGITKRLAVVEASLQRRKHHDKPLQSIPTGTSITADTIQKSEKGEKLQKRRRRDRLDVKALIASIEDMALENARLFALASGCGEKEIGMTHQPPSFEVLQAKSWAQKDTAGVPDISHASPYRSLLSHLLVVIFCVLSAILGFVVAREGPRWTALAVWSSFTCVITWALQGFVLILRVVRSMLAILIE